MGTLQRSLVRAAPTAVFGVFVLTLTVLGADPTPTPTPAGNRPGDGAVDPALFPFLVLGVVISIIIPAARKATGNGQGISGAGQRLLDFIRPYTPWAILSVAVAIALMFLLEKEISTQVAAFVAGYSWDSTVQKFSGKP